MNEAAALPRVGEDERKKTLRFDSRFLQSAMYKHAPFDLALSYSRAVMGFLLFQPDPRDILILGLGGGSLSKYCQRYLPEARVTTVEIDANVIALRDEFEIPADDERFRIVHADGAEYIEQSAEQAFDVIVLDAYDRDGLPEPLCTQDFYDRCAMALRDDGVAVVNYLEHDRRHALYLARLRESFANRVVKILADRGNNQIAYALKREDFPPERLLRERALLFEAAHTLNFRILAAKIAAGEQDACVPV